jgi:hypothetical protein
VRTRDGLQSRTVLGVLQRTPLHGALLEVRADDGNVFRSHMHGVVDLLTHDPACTGCEHDCPWRKNPLGAPFCSVCDDHWEAG